MSALSARRSAPIASSKLLSEAEYNSMSVYRAEMAAIAYWLDQSDIPDHAKVALVRLSVQRAFGVLR